MNGGRPGLVFLLLLLQAVFSVRASALPVLQKVAAIADAGHYDVIIDTRTLASCRKSTLKTARCLPVEDILAPNGRLANWSGIMWLLGSAGLTGTETILVTGQRSDRRDFIAGLLVLAGQQRVTIVQTPLSELISDGVRGSVRSTTRSSIYTARMRSELIVLRNELVESADGQLVLLDGRTESEYYGAQIKAARGGHIPGAIHKPLSEAGSSASIYRSLDPVVYAHDPYSSLAYFTALQVAGVVSRVYLAGWVEWAANGLLPVDSVSYPGRTSPANAMAARSAEVAAGASTGASDSRSRDYLLFAAIAVALFAAGFVGGRKYTARSGSGSVNYRY
ncbi:hypothetical protein AB833_05425 [Chromatiales bacterium (ex Bugula neritina AB1)]|nr:hypothetical protein AB833_05425 [Chromatiales bacterium (ex Bugula neritina AB1)]